MRISILLSLTVLLSLPFTSCHPEPRSEDHIDVFREGYDASWMKGYDEGVAKATPSTSSTTPASTPAATTESLAELTLEDAEDLLDLLPYLPPTFERVDAASQGMSNADMGLGPEVSEVQLFMSDDPFQTIHCIFCISNSLAEQVIFDATMKNEKAMHSLIISTLQEEALELGIDCTDPEILVTYPVLGEFAVLGEGSYSTLDFYSGYDCLAFRERGVCVMLYSSYASASREELLPIGQQVLQRLELYSF